MSSNNAAQQQAQVQREGHASRSAAKQAEREAASTQERRENPQFVQTLRDLGLDDQHIQSLQWLREELGPLAAGAHALANRGPQQERRIEWGLFAEAEQMLVERSPGRLCDAELRELAAGTADRSDASALEPTSPEERRQLRQAMEAVKALQSLGVGAEGLRALSEATVVNRTETLEEDEESVKQKAAGWLE